MLAGNAPSVGDHRRHRRIHPYTGQIVMPTLYNLGGQSGGYLGFGGGFGDSTVSDIGGAVSDFFQAGAYKFRAKGARIEEEEYTQAAALSDLNAQYTKEST